jgi:hypothetical protein
MLAVRVVLLESADEQVSVTGSLKMLPLLRLSVAVAVSLNDRLKTPVVELLSVDVVASLTVLPKTARFDRLSVADPESEVEQGIVVPTEHESAAPVLLWTVTVPV